MRWGRLVLLMLTSAVMGGCASSSSSQASSAASTTPLVLHLDAGSYSVTSSRTTLRGEATRAASVEVDGQFVSVQEGRWHRVLGLHIGANRVLVEATMRGHALVVRSITVTRHRTSAEVESRARARREAEEQQAAERAGESEATGGCTNGTYTNSAGNTVCSPEAVPTAPAGATAKCEDGTYSFSESRSGTCSHHGGVAEWLDE
jgi:Protein of unknown function (DUF3761)